MARKKAKKVGRKRKAGRPRSKTKKYKSKNIKTCSGAGATLVSKRTSKGLKSAAGRKLVKCK